MATSIMAAMKRFLRTALVLGATRTEPLLAYVSFYRGDVKVYEAPPIAVTDGIDPRSKAVPVRLTVALEKLAAGRYDCQVSVLDPLEQKVAFWRGPLVVVP